MRLTFKQTAYDDLLFWVKNDKRKALKILELLKEIEHSPYEGKGQPEALRFNLAGYWSRRIDTEHRLVYRVVSDEIEVLSCRYHYDK